MRFLQLLCLAGALASVSRADTIVYNDLSESSAGADGVDFVGPLYDSFTSVGSGQITDLQLILSGDGDGTSLGVVQVGLFADDANTPGDLIAVLGTVNDDTFYNMPAIYDVGLTSYPTLADDTRYWIGLSGTTTAEWYYDSDSSGIGVASEFFSNQIGVFSNDNDPYQMSVTERVTEAPEPSSSLLLVVGASLVALARLRRRA